MKKDLQNFDNNQLPAISPSSSSSSSSKRETAIIVDSILKHVNGREVSRVNSVKTRSHPAATTEDLSDYTTPIARKKTGHGHYKINNKCQIPNKVNTFYNTNYKGYFSNQRA